MGKTPSKPEPVIMSEAELKTFKMEASAQGCTGMFWRSKPSMSSTVSDSSWPRNGDLIKGRYSEEHPGWVQFENGYWLPVKQSVVVLHEVSS
eukprot:m.180605 g.180605  ORF g.180605 m.180605 type:complete len:92 (+) comp16858_c1_seq2:903-1178(+)